MRISKKERETLVLEIGGARETLGTEDAKALARALMEATAYREDVESALADHLRFMDELEQEAVDAAYEAVLADEALMAAIVADYADMREEATRPWDECVDEAVALRSGEIWEIAAAFA